jgi:hypothetical protein
MEIRAKTRGNSRKKPRGNTCKNVRKLAQKARENPHKRERNFGKKEIKIHA